VIIKEDAMKESSIIIKKDLLLIKKINEKLKEHYLKIENLGILSGLSGIILFQFLYSKTVKSNTEFDIGYEMIDLAIGKINNGFNRPTYCNGIAGFCWVLQHLSEKRIIELEVDSFLSQMDGFLISVMELNLKQNNYDFLHGALGYGFYFLKRYNNTEDVDLKLTYKNNIEKMITYFENTSINDIHGIKWKSREKTNDNISIDLGLAHGITSIINFLTRVYKSQIFANRIEPLIKKAISFLLANESKDPSSLSLFFDAILNPPLNNPSRLGWCYGDLGIGLTILRASKALKNTELEFTSKRILEHTTTRKHLLENAVLDAGLCHGAFGISQIYGSLFRETNDEQFKKSSLYWKEEGIKMANYENGIEFKVWLGVRDWFDYYGLLEGISGIGLSLISHITNFEEEWDECLMIS